MDPPSGEGDGTEKPLAGVTICCTSIGVEQRQDLLRIASDLGADYKHDLTSDVTHLIVGAIDTPKYNFVAKERPDVKVLRIEWLEAVRDAWMEADKVDVAALEQKHRTLPFEGFCICISGWQDLDERQAIIDSIKSNGAIYQGNLTDGVSHLVVLEPSGKKYQWAKANDIKILSYEWLTESIERGMKLDETLFNPLMPEEQRGRGAWRRIEDLGSPFRKRSRTEETAVARADASRRKLRRTASTKFGSQNASIWSEITSGLSGKTKTADEDMSRDPGFTKEGTNTLPAPQESNPPAQSSSDMLQTSTLGQRRSVPRGTFQDALIYIHGFDARKRDQIVKFTDGHQARIMSLPKEISQCSPEELEDGYLVIPHNISLEDLPPLPPSASKLQRVTEWWLERCLVAKNLIDPSIDPFCRPFANLEVRGFDGIGINGTGFTGADLLHFKKLIKLLGAQYEDYFVISTGVLVCNTTREDKLEFATANNIPAVSVSWIWKCVATGKIQPLGPYLLNKIDAEAADKKLSGESSNTSAAEVSRQTFSDSDRSEGQPSKPRTQQVKGSSTKQINTFDIAADDSVLLDESAPGQSALQELPHTNSPKKASQPSATLASDANQTFDLDDCAPNDPSHNNENFEKHAVKTAPESRADSLRGDISFPSFAPSVEPSSGKSDTLNSEIAALRAQIASRPTTASGATEPRIARRARGKLGRAVSGGSNPSMSAKSEEFSQEVVVGGQDILEDEPIASQAIFYEDPEAKQQREVMIRKMGGHVAEKTIGVERVGMAKDFKGAEMGIAGRVAGGRRKR